MLTVKDTPAHSAAAQWEKIEETAAAVCRLYSATGIPPTMREIAVELGLSSSFTALYRVRRAVAAGYLQATDAKGTNGRSVIPVVPPGCCPCCGQERE